MYLHPHIGPAWSSVSGGPPQITGYSDPEIRHESGTTHLAASRGRYQVVPSSPITLVTAGDVQDHRYRLVWVGKHRILSPSYGKFPA